MIESSKTTTKKPSKEPGCASVEGDEAAAFLQGLMTNDINVLETQAITLSKMDCCDISRWERSC